jgi:predicted Zn-dependent peptidase
VFAAGLAGAQPSAQSVPRIKFTDTRLDNGLRVIISEDHYAQVYAICVDKVRSKDERKGVRVSRICSST